MTLDEYINTIPNCERCIWWETSACDGNEQKECSSLITIQNNKELFFKLREEYDKDVDIALISVVNKWKDKLNKFN